MMKAIYEADDGTQFDTEKAALAHEKDSPIRAHIKAKLLAERRGDNHTSVPDDRMDFMVRLVQDFLPSKVKGKPTGPRKTQTDPETVHAVHALAHLSQAETARRLRISDTTVSRIKSGDTAVVDGKVCFHLNSKPDQAELNV
jgi:hypothetical protein|tara:strand:- start:233 stop:658 length:426 start_codon:yes stop_codon:yes gene_type:complete